MIEVGRSYILEEFRLEPEKRVLSRNGKSVRLANRPFQVLLYLIENRDRLVTRDELLERFWDGHEVYDEAVTKCVGAIRKALDDHTGEPRFIETRWREGYRFIWQIEETDEIKFFGLKNGDSTNGNGVKHNGAEPSAIADNFLSDNEPREKNIALKSFNRQTAVVLTILALAIGTAIFLFTRYSQTNQFAPSNSIAVLPFKHLSSSAENDCFSDGMTESLISALSKVEGLKVISRNSVFAFKGKDVDPRQIAEKLGVGAILEGSVRENGDRIRVEVRLVNAADGQIIWAGDNFERSRGDLFEIQDEIARSVTTSLRLRLSSTDEARLTKRNTNNVAAYQAYVKGRYFWKKKTPEGLSKSRELFEEAMRLDPNYAQAYAGLADYYLTGIWYADFPPNEAIEKAKPAAVKALELDNSLAEAHIVRARVAEMEWDWENFRKETEKALELDPNNAHGWQGYAFYLDNIAGQTDEAITAIKRAAELDPLSVSVNSDVGYMLTQAGQTDEAIAVFQKTIETDSQFSDVYQHLGRAYERQEMFAEAVAAYLEGYRLDGTNQERLAAYRAAFEQNDMKGFWQKNLEFLHEDAKKKFLPQFWFAVFYARLGEKDAAFEHLEKAYRAHEPLLVNLKSDYALAPLRSDPRFADLLRRVGLAN